MNCSLRLQRDRCPAACARGNRHSILLVLADVSRQKNPRRLNAGDLDGESRDARGEESSDRGLSPFSSVARLPIHSVEPMRKLLQRLVLELANPFARQAQIFADFTKSHGGERFEAKPHPDHCGLTVLKLV